MAEKFYIADESLGGIEREYVGSEGEKAKVGDYVYLVYTESVVQIESEDEAEFGRDDFGHLDVGKHITLIPTGNVRIDGERIFRMVDRKAEVGDEVIQYKGGKSDGRVRVITSVNERSARHDDFIDEEGLTIGGIAHEAYRVLEPAEVEESPQSVADLIANLAQAVVRLQKEVDSLSEQTDSNAKDIVTFAEEFTEFKEQQTVRDVDISDLSYNVSRFVSDHLKEGLRYERNY